MIRIAVLSLCLVLINLLQAQKSIYRDETAIYLSKIDSAVFIYNYPVFTGLENKNYEARLNQQVAEILLPDSSVLKKMELLKKIPADQHHEQQEITLSVTYFNELLVCLQTRITVTSPGMPGAAGDLYYNTYSIASGNEYNLNNLFTDSLFEAIYKKYQKELDASGAEWKHFKEHVVGFGLIADDSKQGTFTLEIIVNTLYAQQGPMPLELSSEEVASFIKPDGPLSRSVHD